MRLPHLIAAIALLLLSAFLFWKALALAYYTPIGPGPGFFPRWICGLLAIVATVLLVQALRGTEDVIVEWPSRRGFGNAAVTIGSLAAATLLLHPLGFRLTLLVVLIVLLVVFGYRRTIGILILALAGSFGSYQLFHGVLHAPLPIGFFGF